MAVQVRYEPPALNPGVVMHGLVEAAETAGGEALLKASQPLVPVAPAAHRAVVEGGTMVSIEPGTLRDSGRVEHGPEGAQVVYSAVNPADGYDYAAIQHEDENFHHEHGQAHYLGDPMHTASDAILAAIAVELRKL